MPPQRTKSKLFGKLLDRARKAHEAHRSDETNFGNIELPPGIGNGIAQLRSATIGVYKEGENKGEEFFMASGICVEPREYRDLQGNLHHPAGARTSIGPIPFCDTPQRKGTKTFEEHYAKFLNELRKLGVNTEEMDIMEIEATLQSLTEERPYFKFRTWRGKPTQEYPDPKVQHEWLGLIEDYTPSNGEAGEGLHELNGSDQGPTGPDEFAVGEGLDPTDPDKEEPEAEPEEDDPEEVVEEEEGGDDLDALATAADEGNDEEASQLMGMAKGLGITRKQIDEAENWAVVADLIRTARGGAGTEEEEEQPDEVDEPWKPLKGVTCSYSPMVKDPRTKKMAKAKRAIECEITAIDQKTKTATLKDLANGKNVWKGIKLSELTAPLST